MNDNRSSTAFDSMIIDEDNEDVALNEADLGAAE